MHDLTTALDKDILFLLAADKSVRQETGSPRQNTQESEVLGAKRLKGGLGGAGLKTTEKSCPSFGFLLCDDGRGVGMVRIPPS